MSSLAKKAFELLGRPDLVPQERQETPSPTPSVRSSLSLATEAFSEQRGLIVSSAQLGMSVWVVRNRQDGQDLAGETAYPALLLDDVLSQVGKNPADVRRIVLPLLICVAA